MNKLTIDPEGQLNAITAEEIGRWSCVVNCTMEELLDMRLPGYVAMFLMREHGMAVVRPKWREYRSGNYYIRYLSLGNRIINQDGRIVNSSELRDYDIMENDWRVVRPKE